MGEVFLAEDPDLERLVAVKVLSPRAAADPDAQARFQREAKTLAALNHPGIVTIYEIGHDGDQRFISMELVSGRTLREELSRGEMSLDRLLEIAIRVAEALAAAHDAGVLHRDIKPENVMVLGSGGVKVVDFGVARRVEGERPERGSGDLLAALAQTMPIGQAEADTVTADTNTIFGTPGYMAPEILCGDGSSAKSDVYSFGALIYEAIAGRLPFRGNSLMELLGKVMDPRERPPRLDDGESSPMAAPTALADLIDEMLARDPDARPTMAQVRDRLQAILASRETADLLPVLGEAGFSATTVPVDRPRKRRLVAAACIVAAAAAVAIAVATSAGSDSAKPGATTAVSAIEVPEPGSIPVAVAPVSVSGIPALATDNYALAQLLTSVLWREPAFRVVTANNLYYKGGSDISDPAILRGAARDLGAVFLVRTSVEGSGAKVSGTITVVDLAKGGSVAKHSTTATDIGSLVVALATETTRALVPGSEIEPSPTRSSIDSLAAYQQGIKALHDGSWNDAVIAFTRATAARPSFFEAWYQLALASAWGGDSPSQTIGAAEKARALADSPRDKALLRALLHYVQRDFKAAAEILAPLAEANGNDREVLYLFAESLYHDGHYAAGIEQLKRVLRVAPELGVAAQHLFQDAIARKDENAARFYGELARVDDRSLEASLSIALGDYEQLLMSEYLYYRYVALVMLGKLGKARDILRQRADTTQYLSEPIAHALYAGHRVEAASAFAAAWAKVMDAWDSHPETYYMALAPLCAVLIIGDMKSALTTVFEDAGQHNSMFRIIFQTARIHAAPMLGRELLLDIDPATYRLAAAKAAIAAEMRGDRIDAIHQLKALLADPGPGAEYLLRFALARNLHALGRADELREVCLAMARPAVYRPAMLPFLRRCLDWDALDSYPPASKPTL